MKFSEAWLRQYLQCSADLKAICHKLTAIGLEVESLRDLGQILAPFVIAEIVAVRPHPNAERLQICNVNSGDGVSVEVICGAPNARLGMRGVFAPVGSHIPGTGLDLKAGKIRGETSHGMLCSEKELLLSDEHDGIIDLPASAPIGESYARWADLTLAVIEINVTPNRGDCLSVYGIARDLAAAGLGKLKPLKIPRHEVDFTAPIAWQIDANLPNEACPFVAGRSFRGIHNGESPAWLQQRLKAIGLRPISALVDITNYITYDLGRPLHVFDGDTIQGHSLYMRRAHNGENIVALDDKTYVLDDSMTVIADSHAALSIAGIMGGLHSSCTAKTTHVFLEAALFSPNNIAASGRKLSIQSDARYRFERGLDPQFVIPAIEIASQMILDLCGNTSTTIGTITSAGSLPQPKPAISLNLQRLKSFGGVAIPPTKTHKILKDLGFGIKTSKNDKNIIKATPPTWRNDIEGEHCLLEEILRIYGFDKVPERALPPLQSLPALAVSSHQRRLNLIAQALALRGLYEVVTWSFTSQTNAILFTPNNTMDLVELSNPISSQLTHMRPSILANLVIAAAKNRDRGFADVALFEVGPVFHGHTQEQQKSHAAGIRLGRYNPPNWHAKSRRADLFDAKTDVLKALSACGAPIDNLRVWQKKLPPYYHPGKSATLQLGDKIIAYFGELHPRIASNPAIDLSEGAAVFEIYLDNLPSPRQKSSHARPPYLPSPLQPVERDFAFVIPRDTPAESLIAAIKKADKKLIESVLLFDVYALKDDVGKRSVALRVTLQASYKTLTEADLEAVSDKIIASAAKHVGAQLRS